MTLAEKVAAAKAKMEPAKLAELLKKEPPPAVVILPSAPAPHIAPSELSKALRQPLAEVLQAWVAEEMTSDKMPAFHNVHPRNWVQGLLPNLADRLKKAGY